jgi:hypothetical protein
MKLGLQNYAVFTPIGNSCIKFNDNKVNSLQKYDNTQHYRILHKVIQSLSQHNLNISKHHHSQRLR